MKFLTSLSFVIIFTFLLSTENISANTSSKHITIHAQKWALWCRENMDDQQLQIIANTLYLLYANALVDAKMQQFITPLSELMQSALDNMHDQNNPNNELTTLKTLIERLSIITGTRTIYTAMLNSCLIFYEQIQTDITNSILEELQLYAQEVINEQANDKNIETMLYLKNCEAILAEQAQLLHTASGLYKGLSEGQLPINANEQNKSLIILSLILQNEQTLINSANAVTNVINKTCDHAINVIFIGLTIYQEHYKALYNIINEASFDKRYATTLFGMYEPLPKEYQTLLPNHNNVFQHMLQTTKLYTQTETI